MAKNTDIRLQNQIIYSIYIRNHTKEGTFTSVIPDLDRIKALGTDIIWLMPIHPIGVKGKKGSLGCPYANRDYRSVNPEYGSMEDFKALVDAIHQRGMKCMIDVVYNHTSPDSNLVKEHPEFFYRNEKGEFANKLGDWADVIDLDYNNKDLWDYQIESLKMWAAIVDGFRCDVASFVPVEFWKRARKEVEEIHPGFIWLAESVHLSFGNYARSIGFPAVTDYDLYEAFDMEYDYDTREAFDDYMAGKAQLSEYINLLNFEEGVFPANYNKMRSIENHDQPRIASLVKDDDSLMNFTAYLYYLKGTTLTYAGQETVNTHLPSLFDIDKVDWNTGKDISGYMAKLAQIKKNYLGPKDVMLAKAYNDSEIVRIERLSPGYHTLGIFSFKAKSGEVEVAEGIQDGLYVNLIDGENVEIKDGKIACKGAPMIIQIG